MQQNILQSVLKITEQRNIEALEHCLPTSIAELLPINSISLYKLALGKRYHEVEKIIQLSITDTEPIYDWSEEPVVLSSNKLLQDCFQSGSIKELSSQDGNSEIYFPIVIDGTTLAALHVKSTELDKSQRQVLDGLTKIYTNYLAILNESEHDKLTSLLNRHSFEQRFEKLVSIQKHQQQVALEEYNEAEKRQLQNSDHIFLAMLDIDFFKRVNDNFGHVYGDEILLLMATLMRESFRSSDLLFRYGGEEFVILLAPTSSSMAHQALERFRAKVEAYNFPQVGKITVSIGYTIVVEKSYSATVLNHADQALYYSKNNGRNCTHNFERLVEDGHLVCSSKTGSVELF